MSPWRIWTKLGGNSSYKPLGASYAAQGPQKQPEIIEIYVLETKKNNQIRLSPFKGPLHAFTGVGRNSVSVEIDCGPGFPGFRT